MADKCKKVGCPQCNKTFTLKKNLYVHMRTIHGENNPRPSRTCSELCMICGKMFANIGNLNYHMKTVHSTMMSCRSRTPRIECPDCNEKLISHSKLREHLLTNHEITLEYEEHRFEAAQNFYQWKEKLELESLSHYVLDSSANILSEGKMKRYYNCHRSHSHKPRGHNIRARKGVLSNKIGTVCPARMEVLIEGDSYGVSFWKTHVGHSIDVGRTYLSKEVRTEIAGKLKQGVTFQHILDEIRDCANDINSQRTLLLERKDLHNIAQNFNVHYGTRRHADDAVSVHLWVEEMKGL